MIPTKRSNWLLVIVLLASSFVGRPEARQARTITAASCSQAAVQAAIDSASDGDTVVIPNGSCSWTSSSVGIAGKAITVKAASPRGVVLTKNNSTSSHLFTVNQALTGSVIITGLKFVAGTGGGHGSAETIVMRGATGQPIIIHDNEWSGTIAGIRVETRGGLIFGNLATATPGSDPQFVHCKPEALGLANWESPSTVGDLDTTGKNNVYVEDNTIVNFKNQAIDSDGGCRMVFRYNTMTNSSVSSHGPDTGPYGNRHTELYNNTFTFDPGKSCTTLPAAAQDYFIFIRGGVWVITENVIPDLGSCALGSKAEVKMQIQNLRRNGGPMACYAGSYPMPRQIGIGHNGTSYVADPVYIWGNTGGGFPHQPHIQDYASSPSECFAINGDPSITTFVQLNRDFRTTARPGYTKFQYPHPLRPANSTPPTSSTRPSAPKGLKVVGN